MTTVSFASCLCMHTLIFLVWCHFSGPNIQSYSSNSSKYVKLHQQDAPKKLFCRGFKVLVPTKGFRKPVTASWFPAGISIFWHLCRAARKKEHFLIKISEILTRIQYPSCCKRRRLELQNVNFQRMKEKSNFCFFIHPGLFEENKAVFPPCTVNLVVVRTCIITKG